MGDHVAVQPFKGQRKRVTVWLKRENRENTLKTGQKNITDATQPRLDGDSRPHVSLSPGGEGINCGGVDHTFPHPRGPDDSAMVPKIQRRVIGENKQGSGAEWIRRCRSFTDWSR